MVTPKGLGVEKGREEMMLITILKRYIFFKCFPVLGIKPNFLHTRKVLLTLSPLLKGICQIIEDRNATNR